MILTDYAISDNSYVKFMNILKPALVSTSLLFVSAAQAFSSVALPVTSVISHIRSEFNSSEAYQSTSSITLYSIDTAQNATPAVQFDLNATIEKPNKLSLVTTQNADVGVLVLTDGTNVTVFDAPTLHYSTSSVGATNQELLKSILAVGSASLTSGQSAELRVSLTVPSMFLSGTPAITTLPPGVTIQRSAILGIFNGVKTIQLIQSFDYPNKSKIDFAFLIDPSTYKPISFSQYAVTPAGKYLPMIRQDFSKFVLLTHPLPDAGYTFVPPPGSTQVPLPS